MATRRLEEETSRRGFLRRLGDTLWGGLAALVSLKVATSRPQRAWAEEPTGEPTVPPAEPPKPEEGTGQPLPEGTGQPPQMPPTGDLDPAATGQPELVRVRQNLTEEEWDQEVEQLFQHYRVVNEPESMARGGARTSPDICQDTGQGHIDSCDSNLSGCQDSVLCRTQVSGGCQTANACGLSNYGECPVTVICRTEIIQSQ
ncbi:MAG: hypothetical protein JW797_20135 [Bradymonadales bacterium]|nr:hypothetical protein [Bradymonadales bacterium]